MIRNRSAAVMLLLPPGPQGVIRFPEVWGVSVGKVVLTFSMSLDGFIAGPDISLDHAMGVGGDRLHKWMFHGGPENRIDLGMARELLAKVGAVVLGKRTYDVGLQHWGDTPYPVPSFVVTHEKLGKLEMESAAFTFVDGVEEALSQAQAAAAGKVVIVMGANIAQQMLKQRLADEIYIQLVPVLLGGGSRLFENFGEAPLELVCDRAVNSPYITHLKYKIPK
jgi:dihydrofolate reductase